MVMPSCRSPTFRCEKLTILVLGSTVAASLLCPSSFVCEFCHLEKNWSTLSGKLAPKVKRIWHWRLVGFVQRFAAIMQRDGYKMVYTGLEHECMQDRHKIQEVYWFQGCTEYRPASPLLTGLLLAPILKRRSLECRSGHRAYDSIECWRTLLRDQSPKILHTNVQREICTW